MKFERASGVLLHPTSLPGPYGIGDLGSQAYAFCDALATAEQRYWQVLPLGPTGYGDSPYQSFSAFAGNPLLISPDCLAEDGLVEQHVLEGRPESGAGRVDYGGVYEWKGELLRGAYEKFRSTENADLKADFDAFCQRSAEWLEDYALYRAVKASENQRPWYEWPEGLRLRDRDHLRDAAQRLDDDINAERFYQFLFFRQWSALRSYATELGIKIVGDVPIFVARDSADVWCHQDQFKLNADGSAKVVAGVPPDYFSKTGQLWGNPIYDWEKMKADGFRWWISRIKAMLRQVDIIRVDHFRGFAGAWEVPGQDETAEHGSWVDVPGKDLFAALEAEFGDLPFIAEDLGVITADVDELRDTFGFPGMRILQYGFSGDAKNRDLPHNYVAHSAAYTGTHDNDTTAGWFAALPANEREYCLKYLKSQANEIHWDMIRAVLASVADTAIIPLQDVLGLGTEARMNRPALTGGNWDWRLSEPIAGEPIERLADLTRTYGRAK